MNRTAVDESRIYAGKCFSAKIPPYMRRKRRLYGTIRALSPRQIADLVGHSTSQITELHYVKKDTERLSGITEGFEM